MNSYMKNRIYYNEKKNENENDNENDNDNENENNTRLIYTINETQEIDNYIIINNDESNDENNDNDDDDKIYYSWSFCKRLHFYFYYPSIFLKKLCSSVKTFTCKI
jgi:hypothetical protein